MTVVDASVWVAAFFAEDVFHQPSFQWIRDRMLAKEILTTPSLALPELAGAIARRSGFTSDAQAALEALSSLPNLVTVDIDADLALHAADIAADLSLRGADAVYVAVALARNLPLITWDHEVQERAARIVDVRPPLS